MLHHHQRRFDIHRQHAVDVFGTDHAQKTFVQDPCVVHQPIQAAELVEYLLEHGGHRIDVSQIDDRDHRFRCPLCSDLGGERAQRVVIARDDHQLDVLCCQQFADGPADAS